MRLIIILVGLVCVTACASTPDLSTFKSQGEALTSQTEAAVGFYPTLEHGATGNRVISRLDPILDPFQIDPTAFCAIEANQENDRRCAATDQPIMAAARYAEIATQVSSYSQRLADYAAAGELGDGESNPVSDSLTTLMTFARSSPLPGSAEITISVFGDIAQQIRSRQRNRTLKDTIARAQPGIDAIAFSVWSSMQYCDIRPSNRLLESIVERGFYTEDTLNTALDRCTADRIQGRHFGRANTLWSEADQAIALLPGHRYASWTDDQIQDHYDELDRRSRLARQYLDIEDCRDVNNLEDFEQDRCRAFSSRAEAQDARNAYENFSLVVDQYNEAVNTANNDRLARVQAGRRLVRAYLALADAHSELIAVIDKSQAFNAGSLFASRDED